MGLGTNGDRYGRLAVALHWLMFLLLVAVCCTMEFRSIFPKGSDGRELMKASHYLLGMVVFTLVWLRLVVRLSGPVPAIVPRPPQWQSALAGLAHVALYLIMVAMPLLGWAALNADGKALVVLGMPLPTLLAPDHDLAELLEEIHEIGARVGYGLVALHVAATLFHHHLVKDNTLLRMLPQRR